MKHNEDIGSVVEKKLKAAQKSPTNQLWERIDATLEKESKKRRRFVWFFYGISGIVAVLLLFYGIKYGGNVTRDTVDKSKIISERDSEGTPEAVNDSSEIITSTSTDNLNPNTEETSEASIDAKIPVDNEKTTKDVTKNSLNNKKPKTSKKTTNIEESYEVKTTYYYYNSELDKQVQTHDKNIIDSLMQVTTNRLDSTVEYKKTIYKNSVEKDSIN